MLFVNEMAGVRGTPAFLRHMPATADGMTLTDVVFPAFLFITGMAIPLALGGRLGRGEPRSLVWRHVLARTAALLAIGVLMVNDEHVAAQGLVPGPLWTVLMTIAVVLVWAAPEGADADRRWRVWRRVGLVLLVAVILLYRADGAVGLIQMRPRWWGILGLIGWAYLVASAAYLVVGDRPAVLLGGVALMYLVALADEANAIGALVAVRPVVFVGRFLGAHGALTLSGVVFTLALLRHRREGRAPQRFLAPALAYAAALAAAGLVLHSLHDVHPAFWINKVRATAAWCLLSAALTVVAWVVAYDLADVRGWRRFSRAIGRAGENALMIYLLAPFLLALFALMEPVAGINPYGALGRTLLVGTVRSILFAWMVVRLAGAMRARGLALHV
jgi:predicted acyltransferase